MGHSVIVIGNFDGVHRGHRALLETARALEPEAPLICVTFWPHPMAVIRPDLAPPLLCDLDARERALREAGVDRVEVVAFDEAFAHLTPAQFVEQVLAPLDPCRVVVGENFRFGHRAAGDVEMLRELGRGRFEVTGLPLVAAEEEAVSSTAARQALAAGDVASAARVLGRPFRFSGTVVRGDQRGRELGFPTANLRVPTGFAVPADGVYAGWVRAHSGDEQGPWPAAISVGTNPTFDGEERRVESYVLDRTDLQLYGVEIDVDFVARLRGMERYDGLDALIAQMHTDCAEARRILGVA